MESLRTETTSTPSGSFGAFIGEIAATGQEQSANSSGNTAVSRRRYAESYAVPAKTPEDALNEALTAMPDLPEAVRAGILAMVKAAKRG